MEKDPRYVELTVLTEANGDARDTLCCLLLCVDDYTVGNPDAWSLARLMVGSIAEMTSRLKTQISLPPESLATLLTKPKEDLYDAFFEWQWGDGHFRFQNECGFSHPDAQRFCALPIGTEVFDGEFMFAVRASNKLGRFVWRDFQSKEIVEEWFDFDAYLEQWHGAQAKLEKAMTT